MPKKSNTKRTDGRIAVQIYLGKDEQGRRKYKTVYGATQKEANQKADEIRAMLGKGLDVSARSDTFGVWCDRLMSCKKAEISPSYYHILESTRNHLKPLNNKAIADICMFDVADLINDLAAYNPHTGAPSSKKLLTDVKSLITQTFELAIVNRVIDYNPARSVKIPRSAPKSKRRPITDEQIQQIASTPHKAQLAAMIMLYAGLRRGELLALTWSDIDFKNHTIEVNKSVEFVKNVPHLKHSAKTEAGNRLITMPGILSDFLKKQDRQSVYVFPGTDGGIMTAAAWRTLWDSYMAELTRSSKNDKLQIVNEPFTAHQLRHTYATMLYDAGVDVLTAKELLGHTDVKTTLDIYTHLSKERRLKSVTAFDDFVKCKSSASQPTPKSVDI